MMWLVGAFVIAVALLIAVWWISEKSKSRRLKGTFACIFFAAVGAWPVNQMLLGLSRGRVDVHLKHFHGSYWRSTDGNEYWLALLFWLFFAAVTFGLAARGLYIALKSDSSNCSSSGREEA